MRAVAVAMVLLYHAGVPFLPGGFAGVDVFFVISGFLITGMLVMRNSRPGRSRSRGSTPAGPSGCCRPRLWS